ncbi:MAG: hypothetical protein QMC73_10925 [Myxococcota bacterium]
MKQRSRATRKNGEHRFVGSRFKAEAEAEAEAGKRRPDTESRIQNLEAESRKQKAEHRTQNTENLKGKTSNENVHNRRDNHRTSCFDAAFESTLRALWQLFSIH